jgi:hypothetical protein
MSKHTDLSQRLGALAHHWRLKGFPTDAAVYDLAADELDRKDAEIADLREHCNGVAPSVGQVDAGAPKERWSDLMADDAAIDRMARRLMASVSEEIDAVSLPSLESAIDLIEDLILAADSRS